MITILDCKAILLDEAEKLFTSLAKRMVDEAIDEHASKTLQLGLLLWFLIQACFSVTTTHQVFQLQVTFLQVQTSPVLALQ